MPEVLLKVKRVSSSSSCSCEKCAMKDTSLEKEYISLKKKKIIMKNL